MRAQFSRIQLPEVNIKKLAFSKRNACPQQVALILGDFTNGLLRKAAMRYKKKRLKRLYALTKNTLKGHEERIRSLKLKLNIAQLGLDRWSLSMHSHDSASLVVSHTSGKAEICLILLSISSRYLKPRGCSFSICNRDDDTIFYSMWAIYPKAAVQSTWKNRQPATARFQCFSSPVTDGANAIFCVRSSKEQRGFTFNHNWAWMHFDACIDLY